MLTTLCSSRMQKLNKFPSCVVARNEEVRLLSLGGDVGKTTFYCIEDKAERFLPASSTRGVFTVGNYCILEENFQISRRKFCYHVKKGRGGDILVVAEEA